jgi:hypothetical protein
MGQTQVDRIMKTKAPLHMVAGQAYKGAAPQYLPIVDPETRVVIGHNKIVKGIPYVRVNKH